MVAILCVVVNLAARNRTPIKPTIPSADRYQEGKVFLEHADRLSFEKQYAVSLDSQYQILSGNVQLRKNDMFMYCDSAHFYERTNSFDAFGNVRMEQGDTLFVFADELNYDGLDEIAVLYANPGKKVVLRNRDVTLETDIFYYDMANEVGYYNVGGKLTDSSNQLTSLEGEYHPNTKYAYFNFDVKLVSHNDPENTLYIYTDSLEYNTATHIAQLISPSKILNSDGTIYTSNGDYNTNSGLANLFDRSTVVSNKGNTITGDTLIYDRQQMYGEAMGNVILTDSAHQSALFGHYGYFDEARDSAFVTGRAQAKEYSRGDTLYIHGDTINAYLQLPDSTRVTNAFHRVRFYRRDMQGVCDSISVTERDSLMFMYRAPVVWSDNRQIFGDLIVAHFNDSTVDWARLPQFGFMAEHIAEDCYNQLSGSDMTVWFNDSTVRRLYVEGNVMLDMFPMESDSTYNKYVYVESSFMDAYFNGRSTESVHFWPETTSKVTPLYLAKRNSYFLPKFKWMDSMRPYTPEEIFIVPDEMVEMIEAAPPIAPFVLDKHRKRSASPNARAPKSRDGDDATDAPPTEEVAADDSADNASATETSDSDKETTTPEAATTPEIDAADAPTNAATGDATIKERRPKQRHVRPRPTTK